jgi:salicylate hydroxylase
MTAHTSDPDVIVVGGGIGGLAAALALAGAGRRVRVLEQAPEFGEVGAGLQLAPNATRLLRAWGLLDQIVDAGVVPRRLVMRDALDGAELTGLDLADVERRYGAPYVVVHRSDLHAILVRGCKEAGVELVTGCEVTGVELGAGAAAAVSARRRDGGAVVLAADGLTSRLRGMISDDEPVDSSYVAYRGTITAEAIGDGVSRSDVVVYVGPGCHFVQYPLRGGRMFNQVAVFRSAAAERGDAEWGTPQELDAAFDGACAQVRTGLGHLWRDRRWPMFDREPIERWVTGRLALIGDAAHPMLQYLAQGACQAIEDAGCLGTLAGAAGPDPDWPEMLSRYAAVRAVRAGKVQRVARAWGELWHRDGPPRLARNETLRARRVHDYEHVDWLYGPAADTR